jgi:sterol desaturase/sphingolipid hydroxylase (fatty acid hydroxylase superfamily)
MPELIARQPWILGVLLALALLEAGWRSRTAEKSYDLGASLASIGVAAIAVLLKPVNVAITGSVLLLAYQATPLRIPMDSWQYWVAGFFAVEFAYYWFHRWSHEVNWLWASHAVHHSANEMTLPAAIRLGWTNGLSGGWLVFVPLALIGFSPVMIGTLLAANLLYQYGLHTEAIDRLGPLELVLNTPSHHRAHHASNPGWLDCNYGGVLILFDRLFGTFVPEPVGGGLRYGLVKPLHSRNPVVIALRQWQLLLTAMRAAENWTARWRIAVGRPASLDQAEPQKGGDIANRFA